MSQARKSARQALVQALYQWGMAEQNLQDIENQFKEEKVKSKMDMEYFVELLHAIPRQKSELDELIEPCVDRTMAEINPVELAILRMATYELKQRIDIPYRVVINEAVEIAKKYGADQGHKFVNSVLDKLAQDLRAVEVNAQKKS
ncbi:MAG: transcription antitermination factor NusB [Gammaproteobacteria bacterium]|nr:transcription antitermination factor NusB [Gammaproteobacteria bacterium]